MLATVNYPPPSVVTVTFVRPVMNRDEAAEYLRVSVASIDNWITEGSLKCARIGRSVRIRKEWLDEYIEEHMVDSDAVKIAARMLEQMK